MLLSRDIAHRGTSLSGDVALRRRCLGGRRSQRISLSEGVALKGHRTWGMSVSGDVALRGELLSGDIASKGHRSQGSLHFLAESAKLIPKGAPLRNQKLKKTEKYTPDSNRKDTGEKVFKMTPKWTLK